MRDIREISPQACRELRGILFDIDDTFTLHGRIHPGAFAALWRAHEAGLLLVPVTGRPAGWADHIARMWPVDGVVGENGAFYFHRDTETGVLKKRFWTVDPGERQANRRRLDEISREIRAQFPGSALASDQPYRECDLAVDFCEDVSPPLSLSDAQAIQQIFETHGAHAKISSIHVNGWFGDYDKRTMCELFFREQHGIDLDRSRDRFLFCGDSPNDAPMFACFPRSAGVAGIRRFQAEGLLEHLPAFVSSKEGSHGFEEILLTILGRRGP